MKKKKLKTRTPYVKIPIDLIDLPGSELNVFMAILSFRNGKTRRCYPSIDQICKKSKRSRNTVNRAKDALREKGLLDWTTMPHNSNRYWFPGLFIDEP